MNTASRLSNSDLLPSTSRTWGAYSIMSVWFAAVHNIGVYTAAAALLAVGLPAWEALLALCLGYCLTYVGAQLIAEPGQRYGIPFPVFARASFGIFGANVPAIIRAIIAVAWYGIQTYLASQAVMVLVLALAPDLTELTKPSFLGLSALGWICFLGLWALQFVVVTHGMELIRRVQNWAGAVVSLLMIGLAIITTVKAGGHLDWSFGAGAEGGEHVIRLLEVVFGTFTIYSTLLLNLCDFTRFSPSGKSVRAGNLLGLPANGLLFSATVVVVTLSGYALYGHLITDPTELLQRSDNPLLLAVGAALFVFATIGVNIVANLVSPAYDFSNAFPARLTFTKGAILACALSVVVMPWKLYSSTVAVTYFLGAMGALLGPIFGILMVDYYIKRRRHLVVADLYTDSVSGRYHYQRGVNRRAIYCLLPASAVSVTIAVVPALHGMSWSSWLFGAGISALLYHVLTPASAEATTPEPVGVAQ